MRAPLVIVIAGVAAALVSVPRFAHADGGVRDDEIAPSLRAPRAADEPAAPSAPLTPPERVPEDAAASESGGNGPWALTFALTVVLVGGVVVALRRRPAPPR